MNKERSTITIGLSAEPPSTPLIPDYELLQPIGRGSYGDVWLARSVLGRLRAVKLVYRRRFSNRRPFEREFEGIQRFEPISRSHSSQLAIFHVGKNEAEGCFYYVMELADPAVDKNANAGADGTDVSSPCCSRVSALGPGAVSARYIPRTLRQDLESYSRLPIADCLRIGLSLTTALAHLHQHGLVHRDIKPSNVIFVNGVAKLSDIGLVAAAGDTHSIVGTEGYMPPEGPGTPAADLYSLGMVLYEISTGMDRRCFPELPASLWDWPERQELMALNEVVVKACAGYTARRYASAETMREDLERRWSRQSFRCTKSASADSSSKPSARWRVAQSFADLMKGVLRNNGLSIVLLSLFLLFLLGQSIAGYHEHNRRQHFHGQSPISYLGYLASARFWEATLENWESEFLQMGACAIFTVFLFQRGSAKSKEPDRQESSNAEPAPKHSKWPTTLRRGRWRLKLYEHSLSLTFLGLFLFSWIGHAIAGLAVYNAELNEHGHPPWSLIGYFGSGRFWFESLQNWQSEFLAVAAIVILSIWLREKGSPESKPVEP